MRKIDLGTWTCQSGNRCGLSMTVQKPARVSLLFSWDTAPSPDDREEWSFVMFAEALSRGMEHAFQHRAAIEAIRRLEASGEIEREGVARDGEWIFRRAGEEPSNPSSSGVVSLAVRRAGRRRRSTSHDWRVGRPVGILGDGRLRSWTASPSRRPGR